MDLQRSRSGPPTSLPRSRSGTDPLQQQRYAAELAFARLRGRIEVDEWPRAAWLKRVNTCLENAAVAQGEHALEFLITAYSLIEWLLCGDERQLLRTDSTLALGAAGDRWPLLLELASRVAAELERVS